MRNGRSDQIQLKDIKKISILYNLDKKFALGQEDILSVKDYIETVYDIKDTLIKEGYEVDLHKIDENNYKIIRKIQTDFIFNLCYGIGEIPNTEFRIPEEIEKTNIPYSGSTSHSIKIGTNKEKTKKFLLSLNIPTPRFQIFRLKNKKLGKIFTFPLIVKPIQSDGSIGIQNSSVVETKDKLSEKIVFILNKYKQPALVEEFIDGRELRVTILGNKDNIEVLPISELVFGKIYKEKKLWKIDDFEAKNSKNSLQYKNTFVSCPARIHPKIRKKIEDLSIYIYQKLNGRGYARLDLRLSNDNTPYFLEINFNPGIGREDAASTTAYKAGYNYSSFLKKIIKIGLLRK